MGVIDRNVRLPLVLFALCGSLALSLFVWIELSSGPPVTLLVNSGATRSAPFRIYGGGLHLVVLRVDEQDDQDRTRCALGAKPDVATCVPGAAPVSWAIYRRGQLHARDTRGPDNAVSDSVSFDAGIARRELGTVKLSPGGDYVLEIRTSGDGRSPLDHPTVTLEKHPWEFKAGGGAELLLGFLAAIVAAAITMLWLAAALLGAALSRRRRRR